MQMCVQDLLCINFSRNLCYDTISTYDTLVPSLFINQLPYQYFCGPCLHDTSYNTSTMPSLRILLYPSTSMLSAMQSASNHHIFQSSPYSVLIKKVNLSEIIIEELIL
jgi:hypothetical protein